MYYSGLDWYSTQNGEGIRIALFVSGCRIHCKNCFNKEAWDFHYGKEYTSDIKNQIVEALKKESYYAGLSILGGEPMEPENRDALFPLVQEVHNLGKSIWVYTGYTYNSLTEPGMIANKQFLGLVDVLVDGPFVEAFKDPKLLYRGSSNQNIIKFKRGI